MRLSTDLGDALLQKHLSLLLLPALAACVGTSEPEDLRTVASAGPSPSCLVARVGEVGISVEDVRKLRTLIAGPRSGSAVELAIDVTAASIQRAGDVHSKSMQHRWIDYREHLKEIGRLHPRTRERAEAAASEFRTLREQLGTHRGPCYENADQVRMISSHQTKGTN